MLELIINLILPVAVIAVAMITGSILEKNHYASIKKREAVTQNIPILTGRQFPADRPVLEARLVQGAVVVSIDHFKRFLASLRNVFGGGGPFILQPSGSRSPGSNPAHEGAVP